MMTMMVMFYLIMMFIITLVAAFMIEAIIGLNVTVTLLAVIAVGVMVLNILYFQVHFQQDKNNSE